MADQDTAESELFGASTPAPAAKSAPKVDPDTDAAVRTAYAAAKDADGWRAAANVIRNRAVASGKPFSAVISEPNAFEETSSDKYKSLKAGSQQYQDVLSAISPVLQGQERPVGDADAYYSPTGQTAKGRKAPDWSIGRAPVANVGGNVFYKGVYSGAPAADPSAEHELFGPGAPTPAGAPTAAPSNSDAFGKYAAKFPGWNPPAGAEKYYTVPQSATDEGMPGSLSGQRRDAQGNPTGPQIPLSDAQVSGVHILRQSGKFDPNAPSGSATNPWVVPYGTRYPDEKGAWYFPVDSANPRQVGDEELTYNKRFDLQQTPEGRQALADAEKQIAAQGQHQILNDRVPITQSTSLVPAWAQDVYAGLQNRIARSEGTANPLYSPQQFDDAHYVALREAEAKEAAQRPQIAAADRILGNAVSIPATLEFGGALTAPAREALGPVGSFIGGEAGQGAGGGNLLMRTLSKGTSGGIQGATAAGLTYDDSNRPLVDQLGTGAAFGSGLLGGGTLASAAGRATGRALLGAPAMDSATRNLLQTAADHGIQLRAGQMSSNPFMRYADSELGNMPFTGYAESSANQRQAFTRAVANTFGEDASGLTPEVMSHARSRIGQMFDQVAANTSIPNRDDVLSNLGSVVNEASAVLPESDMAPLRKQVENIASSFDDKGVMSGQAYQALTRRGTPLDRAMQSANPNIRYYAGELRDTLDDALESNAKPEDLDTLRSARLQWKNMRTVEDLAEKAGPDGQINPTLLKGQVRKSYKDYAYTGAGDIGHLAEIGQRFLSEPPNSGTASRTAVRNLLTGAGMLGAGEAAAYAAHNPMLGTLGLLGAGATQAIPPIAARALNNPLTRSLFVDQSVPAWARAVGGTIQIGARPVLPLGVEATNMLLAPPVQRLPGPQGAQ